tara:strand:+ start:6071 stop:6346 length:276 start_codon:yes stop_codon:yes gene_type:complete
MNGFFYFIFYIIFSIFIIYGIHEFWLFLVDTYSTKKTKDLVNIQTNKYVQIIDDLQNNQHKSSQDNDPFITKEEKQNMNDELQNFLLEQTD